MSVPGFVTVRVTEHVADAPTGPDKAQLVPPVEKETVPVGRLVVPVSMSVTVTTQLVASITTNADGVQTREVEVDLRLVLTGVTVTLVLPELVTWAESPP